MYSPKVLRNWVSSDYFLWFRRVAVSAFPTFYILNWALYYFPITLLWGVEVWPQFYIASKLCDTMSLTMYSRASFVFSLKNFRFPSCLPKMIFLTFYLISSRYFIVLLISSTVLEKANYLIFNGEKNLASQRWSAASSSWEIGNVCFITLLFNCLKYTHKHGVVSRLLHNTIGEA